MNLDQFGRYKGGLPKLGHANSTANRANSANSPGKFTTRMEIETYSDQNPEYNIVDSEVAESFKDFHQKFNRDKSIKQPWFTFEVDYEYFTLKTFREKYLPWIRIGLVFLVGLPIIYKAILIRSKMDA
jgi:hypothetical protein